MSSDKHATAQAKGDRLPIYVKKFGDDDRLCCSPSADLKIGRAVLARDLQELLGILALFALLSPFRICSLLILLIARGTDPVSATTLQIVGPFNYTGAERRWPGRI